MTDPTQIPAQIPPLATIAFVCPRCRATVEMSAVKLARAQPDYRPMCGGREFHDHDVVSMIREDVPRMPVPDIAGAIWPADKPISEVPDAAA